MSEEREVGSPIEFLAVAWKSTTDLSGGSKWFGRFVFVCGGWAFGLALWLLLYLIEKIRK